jgi:hypothetical protein
VGFTVREMLVWFVSVPEEPVTAKVNVPIEAVALETSVNALVPVVLTGLKDAVTPFGKPDIDKLTVPVKLFSGVTVIVLVPLVPCRSVTALGEAETEKLGPEAGQLFTRFAAFTLPIPVAKSQPVAVPYAGRNELSDVERTPTEPSAK